MTFNKSIRQTIIFLLVLTTTISCSKDDEPSVDLGTQASGTYNITSIRTSNSQEVKTDGLGYRIELKRVSNKTVSFTMITSSSASVDEVKLNGTANDITLTASDASGKFNGSVKNNKDFIGTISVLAQTITIKAVKEL